MEIEKNRPLTAAQQAASMVPSDTRTIEAIHRMALSQDGRLFIDHMRKVLSGMDVQSRRMFGEPASVMAGRRISIEDMLVMFENIAETANRMKVAIQTERAKGSYNPTVL